MCGIVGMFDTHGVMEIDNQLLQKMNETLHHRGPNEGGTHTELGIGFGHRRLSVIDIYSGQQPLFNEDYSVVVVFNGEIYNFVELKEELSKLGHIFRSHCDTEVIVHAWEQWGKACVNHFSGMFAFAIWDRNEQTLFLARDHLGVKPLFWSLLPNGLLIFGSELKSLMAMPTLSRKLDECAVENYFAYGYVPEPSTIFKNVYKLAPGHFLSLKVGDTAAQPQKFWDVPFVEHASTSEEETKHELIARLRASVKSQMKADVPLGAFLSGGVDSSAVVAMMSEQSQDPVNTCSIKFDDPAYDESEFALKIATRYNTRHQTETVGNDDYGLIDTLAKLYDEPYADSSAIPTYRVCQLARKRVTVALSGDGGDENFAGYRRYRYTMAEQRVRSKFPLSFRKPVFGILGSLYPKADWAPRIFRAKTTFESLSQDLVGGYFHSVSIMPDRVRDKLFSKTFRKQLGGYRAVEVMRQHAAQAPTDIPLSLIQYLDLKTYLPGDILTKVDRASMAHALEVRVPLLDHKFVEWVSGLTPTVKLRDGVGKYIFKKSLEDYLPHDILYRQKMGFSVPLASWFRGPLKQVVRDALLGPNLADTGIFNTDFLNEMVENHQSGKHDYSAPIWTILMFEAFLRNTQGMVTSARNIATVQPDILRH